MVTVKSFTGILPWYGRLYLSAPAPCVSTFHETSFHSIPKTPGRHDFPVKMFGCLIGKFPKCDALIIFHLLFLKYFKGVKHVHCIIMPPRRFHAIGCARRNAGSGGKKYARESIIQSVYSNPGVAQHTGEEPGTGEGAKDDPKPGHASPL